MKKSSKPAAKTSKKTVKKSTKKVAHFEPTVVALAVASAAVISLIGFTVIGWSLSL